MLGRKISSVFIRLSSRVRATAAVFFNPTRGNKIRNRLLKPKHLSLVQSLNCKVLLYNVHCWIQIIWWLIFLVQKSKVQTNRKTLPVMLLKCWCEIPQHNLNVAGNMVIERFPALFWACASFVQWLCFYTYCTKASFSDKNVWRDTHQLNTAFKVSRGSDERNIITGHSVIDSWAIESAL